MLRKEFKPKSHMHEEVHYNIIYIPNIVFNLCTQKKENK